MTRASHRCGLCRGEFANAADCFHAVLVDRGARGIGSTEMRSQGLTGNPSERCRELRQRGVAIVARRRRAPGGRHQESHYVLLRYAPGGEARGHVGVSCAIDLTDPAQRAAWDRILPRLPPETERRAA